MPFMLVFISAMLVIILTMLVFVPLMFFIIPSPLVFIPLELVAIVGEGAVISFALPVLCRLQPHNVNAAIPRRNPVLLR